MRTRENLGTRLQTKVVEYSIRGKELGWILLHHRKKNVYLDLTCTRFRIHSVFKNFHSGERNSSPLELPVLKERLSLTFRFELFSYHLLA